MPSLGPHHLPTHTLGQLRASAWTPPPPADTLSPSPRQIFIVQTVLQQLPASGQVQVLPMETQKMLLIYIRMVTWNQILDPWVYILFRRAVLQRIHPSLRSRPSILSLYPVLNPSLRRKLTADSVLQ